MLNILLYSCPQDIYKENSISTKPFNSAFSCLYYKYFNTSYEKNVLPHVFNIVSQNINIPINIHQKIPGILHYIWITNSNYPSTYPMCNEIELAVNFLDYDIANLWSNLFLPNNQNEYLCNKSLFISTKKVYDLNLFYEYIHTPMYFFLSQPNSNYYIIIAELLRAAILSEHGGIVVNGSYTFSNNPYILNEICDFMVGCGVTFNGGYVAAKPNHDIIQTTLRLMYENLTSYTLYNGFMNTEFIDSRIAIELFFQGSLEIAHHLYGNRNGNIDCIFPETFLRSFAIPGNTDGYNMQINHSNIIIKKVTWVDFKNIGYWRGVGQFHFSDISSSIKNLESNTKESNVVYNDSNKTITNSNSIFENKCYKSNVEFIYYIDSSFLDKNNDVQYYDVNEQGIRKVSYNEPLHTTTIDETIKVDLSLEETQLFSLQTQELLCNILHNVYTDIC